MLKRNKKILVTSIILIAVIVFLGIGYFSGFFFYAGITPCIPPPNLMVDGAATARVFTWVDSNGNGSVDIGEEPLPKVEIIFPPSYPDNKVTDISGTATTSEFKAGCVCNCWEGSFVKIKVPDGYRATTPISVELTSEDTLVEFGFIKVIP